MTQKETFELGIDLITFLDISKESNDSADVANAAMAMVKGILERSPKLRYEIWEWNREEILNDLDLDYGAPF